ncbi:MAG TPA: hypothetical protein EYG68_10180 [Leucothrix mucor]|nr:hypothetical protein [Leucothrix mucor]
MIDKTRRKLLKTIGYGAALSATAVSSSAIALSASHNASVANPADEVISGLSIFQQQSNGKEVVSLMNLSNEAITLDANAPVSLKNINDSLMISLNAANDDKTITLQAGERFVFNVETVAHYAKLSSTHKAFNGVVAIAA